MKISSKNLAVPEISPTMREALQMMLQSNAKSLYRYQGGFWSVVPAGAAAFSKHSDYIGSSTVNALLSRGLVDVSESRTGRNGSFPIEVRLNHLSYEALKNAK